MKTLLVFALASAVSAFASGPSANGVTLPKITKTGLTAHYADAATLNSPDTKIVITAKTTATITQIDADGSVTTDQADSDSKGTLNGKPITPDPPSVTLIKTDAAGKLISYKSTPASDDAWNSKRFNQTVLILPDHPVEYGSSWTVEVPANDEIGSAPFKAVYQLVKQEKWKTFDVYEIKFTIKETGDGNHEAAAGTILLDVHDGIYDKMEASFSYIQVPSGPNPFTGTEQIERTS